MTDCSRSGRVWQELYIDEPCDGYTNDGLEGPHNGIQVHTALKMADHQDHVDGRCQTAVDFLTHFTPDNRF